MDLDLQQAALNDDAGTKNADCHYLYDRRLAAGFATSISNLVFSEDGRWLVSTSGSCEPKLWDAKPWAVATSLRCSRKEECRDLCVSPGQCWLVIVQPSRLNVFVFKPPWDLALAIPTESTGDDHEWCCAAFMPGIGGLGVEHLAAASTTRLTVFDYSKGWGGDTPRRTHSLLRFDRPTSVVYAHGGDQLLCGFASGEICVWDSASLAVATKVQAHTGALTCLAASPADAAYEPCCVSCGVDKTICVWDAYQWSLETSVFEPNAGAAGFRSCQFSKSGTLLMSVGEQLCIWSVCRTKTYRPYLQIHQRVSGVGTNEAFCSAAFCTITNAVAAGAVDGALGLWRQAPGPPKVVAVSNPSAPGVVKPTSAKYEMRLPRPMRKVSQQVSPAPSSPPPTTPAGLPPVMWSHRTQLRPADASVAELAAAREQSRAQAEVTPQSGTSSTVSSLQAKVVGGQDKLLGILQKMRSVNSLNTPVDGTYRTAVMKKYQSLDELRRDRDKDTVQAGRQTVSIPLRSENATADVEKAASDPQLFSGVLRTSAECTVAMLPRNDSRKCLSPSASGTGPRLVREWSSSGVCAVNSSSPKSTPTGSSVTAAASLRSRPSSSTGLQGDAAAAAACGWAASELHKSRSCRAFRNEGSRRLAA
eukprot:TRINITY_DN44933_c0_g1_i1.p1 TRINITY_DN44933_c0_g1~~TRINITY_DN44933_c0_g1_i1.p1  ORF type:complete len:645 (-),score=66.08 TRINITY_DN44933_c0_g1_i1:60-1994(-)